MATYSPNQLRNVALVGHSGAGKTSLADAIFYAAGETTRLGRVDDQTSNSDFEPEEQKRGSSVQTTVLPCTWGDGKINLLDTPGYADFKGDMVSALRVSDSALLVISAPSGIEVGTSQAWDLCEEFKIPKAVVINKLDRENTDFNSVMGAISSRWGRQCVAVQLPQGSEESFSGVTDLLDGQSIDGEAHALRERIIEAAAEADTELEEKYLLEESLDQEEILRGLRKGILERTIVPVFVVSATTETAIPNLIDAIFSLLPSPADTSTNGNAVIENQTNLVFKTSADPFVGKISYFRVYGPPIKADSQVWNEARGENERVGQLYTPKGKEQVPTGEVGTGDIGVVPKLSVTQTGDTLSDKSHPVTLPTIEMPNSVFDLAVTPKTQADLDKMGTALQRIIEEDPSLQVERNPDTRETIMRGLGDVHVASAIERIERKFGVQLNTALPKIAYRETISTSIKSEYRHRKQTGGSGQYGHVIVELSPRGRGKGFAFESKVSGGNVPKEYIPSVEKGVVRGMDDGVLAGFPVVDVGVTLLDGSSHSVDSSGMAFELAGSYAFRQGVNKARPVLLEPVMNVTVITPDDLMGEIMGDLNTRRSQISGMDPQESGLTSIMADVPLAAMQRYATELRSLSQSRATFIAEFAYYAEVPQQEAEKVITVYKEDKETISA